MGGFIGGLVLSEGEYAQAISSGLSASIAEVMAESFPLSLERETRGEMAKIGMGLLAALTHQDVGLSLFSAFHRHRS